MFNYKKRFREGTPAKIHGTRKMHLVIKENECSPWVNFADTHDRFDLNINSLMQKEDNIENQNLRIELLLANQTTKLAIYNYLKKDFSLFDKLTYSQKMHCIGICFVAFTCSSSKAASKKMSDYWVTGKKLDYSILAAKISASVRGMDEQIKSLTYSIHEENNNLATKTVRQADLIALMNSLDILTNLGDWIPRVGKEAGVIREHSLSENSFKGIINELIKLNAPMRRLSEKLPVMVFDFSDELAQFHLFSKKYLETTKQTLNTKEMIRDAERMAVTIVKNKSAVNETLNSKIGKILSSTKKENINPVFFTSKRVELVGDLAEMCISNNKQSKYLRTDKKAHKNKEYYVSVINRLIDNTDEETLLKNLQAEGCNQDNAGRLHNNIGWNVLPSSVRVILLNPEKQYFNVDMTMCQLACFDAQFGSGTLVKNLNSYQELGIKVWDQIEISKTLYLERANLLIKDVTNKNVKKKDRTVAKNKNFVLPTILDLLIDKKTLIYEGLFNMFGSNNARATREALYLLLDSNPHIFGNLSEVLRNFYKKHKSSNHYEYSTTSNKLGRKLQILKEKVEFNQLNEEGNEVIKHKWIIRNAGGKLLHHLVTGIEQDLIQEVMNQITGAFGYQYDGFFVDKSLSTKEKILSTWKEICISKLGILLPLTLS